MCVAARQKRQNTNKQNMKEEKKERKKKRKEKKKKRPFKACIQSMYSWIVLKVMEPY